MRKKGLFKKPPLVRKVYNVRKVNVYRFMPSCQLLPLWTLWTLWTFDFYLFF